MKTRWTLATSLFLFMSLLIGQTSTIPTALPLEYHSTVRPLLDRYCNDCHSGDDAEAEIDLAQIESFAAVQADPNLWIKVDEMLKTRQMPPKKSDQPSDAEQTILEDWLKRYLSAEAESRAGDPGRVVLRRLNNAEYTYTIRDLTGIDTLEPTREFPVDGAAGEGFINTGDALSVSPSLVQKYLDAAKEIATHAVLQPNGIRFSSKQTTRDWTDELLTQIRDLYARYTSSGGGMAVNLQGIQFDTNQGGVLPIEEYLQVLLENRTQIETNSQSIRTIASAKRLSPKYLQHVWETLTAPTPSSPPSFLLDRLRSHWQQGTPTSMRLLNEELSAWQERLWKLMAVGHIERQLEQTGWLVEENPLRERQEFSVVLPTPPEGQDLYIYLSATDVGDGHTADYVVWENPRLTGKGQVDLLLRDVPGLQERLNQLEREALKKTSDYLAAASEIDRADDLVLVSRRHAVRPDVLANWLSYLNLTQNGIVDIAGHYKTKIESAGNYDFVKGWGDHQTPFVLANTSNDTVRIPGRARSHTILAHPSPSLYSAVAWQSSITGSVKISGSLEDAHPECGNGVEWLLLHQTQGQNRILSQGVINGAGRTELQTKTHAIKPGEVITLVIGSREGNHGCDLTELNLHITETAGEERQWNLSTDVASDITASNPHSDRYGNPTTWHFYHGEMAALSESLVDPVAPPPGSLIEEWLASTDATSRIELAAEIQELVNLADQENLGIAHEKMLQHFRQLAIPKDRSALMKGIVRDNRFGQQPTGPHTGDADLVVKAPSLLKFRIPQSLAKDRTLKVTGYLDPIASREGSVQLQVTTRKPESVDLTPEQPILTTIGSQSHRRWEASLRDHRDLFPPALCYSKIVPVDEVVTMTLFYREDHHLQRLMLSPEEQQHLDQLWDELKFVSREPLQSLVAYEQIVEFSTQDRPDLVIAWKPIRETIEKRAKDFQQRLIDTEPKHVNAVITFAERAWRRPLQPAEKNQLRELNIALRADGLQHDESIRLMLARVLTAPAFLYRLEEPGPSADAVPVSQIELANRLSYFLWSSQPDAQLRSLAESGVLDQDDALLDQARRLLRHPRIRRLAVEFACQWLHLRSFDENNEKNESLYPEFPALRTAMYEESVRFFTDLFMNNGSILDIFSADHLFVNESLAKHYGISDVGGSGWHRVNNAKEYGRGGILSMASILAKQSGASRTSPILRGNWVSETLLGERLPRPPLDVPVLPEAVPEGLTARELIEQHSSNPACAKCHARIDPYGFALEQYDAIGRLRPEAVNTSTQLIDGRQIEGHAGLQNYLAIERREDVINQFCRKLLGFALGRSVQLSDNPLLAEMHDKLKATDYRFESAIESIVQSPQFRQIRGRLAQADE